MKLNEIRFGAAVPVDGYGPGFFRVGGRVWRGPVIVTAGGAVAWGGWDDPAPLLALLGRVDVIFFGMGSEIAHLPEGLRAALDQAGLGAEVMASPTACRSYNVLLSEGRRVAAALIPVA